MPAITVNGVELYYEAHGSGAPLVVLGGLGQDVAEMGMLTGPLARQFQIIAIDNRGSGRMAEQMRTLIPNSRLVLIDGGHLAPLLAAHQRLVSEIRAFLTASS